MRLNINGNPILNLDDLKEHFDPLILYDKRKEFSEFAQIHCCFDSESTDSITNDDWIKVLNDESKDIRLTAELIEKLDAIKKSILADDSENKALKLLAICELAGMDAREISFNVKKINSTLFPPDAADGDVNITEDNPQIIRLKPRLKPYVFLYHEGESLGTNERIKSYKIEAESDTYGVNKVRILLCKGDESSIAKEITIEPDGYIYCNVSVADNDSKGKIIKFLPLVSQQNMPTQIAGLDNFSCFASGETCGFLLIKENRVLYNYYEPIRDDPSLISLFPSSSRKIVEITFEGDDYKLLTDDGRVITKTNIMGSSERLVSLVERDDFVKGGK